MRIGRFAANTAALTLAMVLCIACTGVSGGASNKPPAPVGTDRSASESVGVATFAIPPAGSGRPFGATSINLPSRGYVEEEFLVRGLANRYRIKDPQATAEVVDRGHAYSTRILVRRPTNPARFNGVVLVE